MEYFFVTSVCKQIRVFFLLTVIYQKDLKIIQKIKIRYTQKYILKQNEFSQLIKLNFLLESLKYFHNIYESFHFSWLR